MKKSFYSNTFRDHSDEYAFIFTNMIKTYIRCDLKQYGFKPVISPNYEIVLDRFTAENQNEVVKAGIIILILMISLLVEAASIK